MRELKKTGEKKKKIGGRWRERRNKKNRERGENRTEPREGKKNNEKEDTRTGVFEQKMKKHQNSCHLASQQPPPP